MFQQVTTKEVKTVYCMEVSTRPPLPCSVATTLSPMSALQCIPEEIILNIFRYLDIRSIGKMGMTCHSARFLWMRLLKATYKEKMMSATKAEFKMGLERKALLSRTRKDLGFPIHTDEETLGKIESLTGIRFLGTPRRCEKSDGETTTSDSLLLLLKDIPFLSFEEIAILGSTRVASYLIADQLGLQEALNLTPSEFAVLDNPWIYALIGEGRLTVEQAMMLTDKQFSILGQRRIYDLIKQGILEVQEALTFDDMERERISIEGIYLLVKHEKVKHSRIKHLSFNELELLNRKLICDLIIQNKLSIDDIEQLQPHEAYHLDNQSIYNLVMENKISLEEAKGLSWEEHRRLDGTWICNLILADKLELSDVKCLRETEFNNLNNEWIFRLIVDGSLEVDETKRLLSIDLEDGSNEFRNLNNRWIYQLIEKDILAIDQVKKFSSNEFCKFSSNWIYDLIVANKISVNDVRNLSDLEFDKVNNEWISRMICDGTLKLSEAKRFGYQEINNLDNEGIYHLIRANRLELGRAKWIGSDEKLIELNNIGLGRLIRNNRLPLRNPRRATGYMRRLLKSDWILRLLLDGENGKFHFYLGTVEKLKTRPYRVRMLRQSEWNNLNNKWIYTLICCQKITIDDAKRLPRNLFRRLSCEYGSLLVSCGVLTVEEVEDFTDKEYTTLSSPGVAVLLAKRRLCIKDALQLSTSAVYRFEVNLNEQEIDSGTSKDVGEDAVYRHLAEIEEKATTNGASASRDEEFKKRYEDSPWIRALVENPNIEFSLEDAKKLFLELAARFRQSAWDNLNNKQIYDLIANGYHSVDGDQMKWIAAGKLTIAIAKNLPRGLFSKLNSECMVRLICRNALSVESVRDLSDEQCRRLHVDGVARLIIGNDPANLDGAQSGGLHDGRDLLVKDIVELSDKGFMRACHPPMQQLLSMCLLKARDLENLTDNEF